MPQRFGASVDYGAQFASLARSNDSTLRSRAMAFDRRREEEQSARDSLMFKRYEEGKVSGGEILAYIRSRINQTSYDKTLQRRWREAYVQYSTAVADNAAEAAYAETGNIHALIAHYANRLSGAAKGTPEATELAQRVRQLRQQRDSDNLERGARRIARQIQRGDASTKDLIAFYKDQLQRLPGNSPLRQQVRDALVQAQAARRDELFTIANQKIETELGTGSITPQQAANRKKAILDRFDVQGRDPVAYWKAMDEITKLRATPDPGELNKLYTQVQSGQIPFKKFQNKLFEFADLIAPYDAARAWELRNMAVMGIEGATPLENPDIIGGSNASKVIAHISQLDGSKYSQVNCTMAAAAMLGHAMGVNDLSGGDLRWLSGVTSDATNIQQAQYALQQAGVKNTRLSWSKRIEFEKFKKRLANGAPAVLSGWLGDIPSKFNASGIIGGHAMFAAGYDAKRDAFLMLDPAKSRDKGTWWPASVVENFGWGGERHGQALFAPRGTINPKTIRNWKGARTIHVSVDDRPQRPDTPSTYHGQFNPGPSDATSAVKAIQKSEERKRRQRAKAAGIGNNIDTNEEAMAEIDRYSKTVIDNQAIIDAYAYEKSLDPEQDAISITIGGDTQTWTSDDITNLTEDVLFSLDGQELLYTAMGEYKSANAMRQAKLELITSNAQLNTISHDYAENRLLGDVSSAIQQVELSGDPAGGFDVVEQLVKGYTAINQPQDDDEEDPATEGAPPPPPGSDPAQTEVQQQVDELDTAVTPQEAFEYGSADQLLESLSDPEMASEDRIALLIQWADANDLTLPKGWDEGKAPGPEDVGTPGDTWARVVTYVNAMTEVQRGEAAFVVQGGGISTLPTVMDAGVEIGGGRSQESVPAEAQTQDGQNVQGELGVGAGTMLDISGLDLDYSHSDQLPKVVIKIDGVTTVVPAVPEREPYPGANFLKATAANSLAEFGLKPNADNDYYLTQDEIRQLEAESPGAIARLIRDGALEEVPFTVQTIQMPSYVDENGKVQAGSKWFEDPKTRRWSRDGLPFVSSSDDPTGLTSGIGAGYVGIDPEASTYGNPQPATELDPDLMDQGTTGVIAPFQANISKAVLEQKLHNGELGLDYGMDRDADGNIVPDDAMQHAGMYTDLRSMSSIIRSQFEQVKNSATSAAEELAPEEPQSNFFMDLANIAGSLHDLAQTDTGQKGVLDIPQPQRTQAEAPEPQPVNDLPKIGDWDPDLLLDQKPKSKDKVKEPKLPSPSKPRPFNPPPPTVKKTYDPLSSISVPKSKTKKKTYDPLSSISVPKPKSTKNKTFVEDKQGKTYYNPLSSI